MKKVCSVCKKAKDFSEFWNSSRNKDGKQYMCKKCSNKSCNEAIEKDPRAKLLSHAKTRATRKGIPFDIVKTDIYIPEYCPVLGIKLERGKKHFSDSSPTLDRIVPELGYVKGNIEVISHRANSLKRDATPDEIKKLYEYYCLG